MLYFSETQYKNTSGNGREIVVFVIGKKHCAQWGQINYEVELELFF